MKSSDLFDFSRALCQRRQPHAWVTVVAVSGPSSAYLGAQAIVEADGAMHGWIGGGCVRGVALATALRAIDSGTPQRIHLSNTAHASESVDVHPMLCASDGEVELFVQPVSIAPRVRIYGSTPVAEAAASLARLADFEPVRDEKPARENTRQAFAARENPAGNPVATRADGDEVARENTTTFAVPENIGGETYALVATQGDGDEAALEQALRSPARAILAIASPRKAERLRAAMALRGFSQERLNAIQAPAGPDIGAVTPSEIALSAISGLVAAHRKQRNAPSTHRSSPQSSTATGYVNPVCGAVVDPARALSQVTMQGQTHYFCCAGCRTEFDRNPEKYLAIGAHLRAPVS
jgi:xanthine dehydrogenase accessory factor